MTVLAYAERERAETRFPDYRRYRGFACPHEPFDDRFLAALQVDYSRRLVNTLLRRFGAMLDQSGDILPFLRGWGNGEVTFATVWDPSFGLVRELLAVPEPPPADVLSAFAALALRFCEQGTEGGFELRLAAPRTLRFGHLMLPRADWIRVDMAGGKARIRLGDGPGRRTIELECGDDGWTGDGVDPLVRLRTPVGPVTLLPPLLADPGCFGDLSLAQYPRIVPEVQRKFEALYELVATRTPHYLPWFARGIKFIVPYDAPNGEAQGGSYRFRPAMVSLSHEAPVLQLADYLAHEATHEYFYMLQPVKRIDDGSDQTLYLNPIINAQRHIGYMALAFHAFANDVLFCRDYLATGPDLSNYCVYREQTLVEALAPFRRLLTDTRALTDVGRGLVDPLLERL